MPPEFFSGNASVHQMAHRALSRPGLWISARQMEARLRIPPEQLPGNLSSHPATRPCLRQRAALAFLDNAFFRLEAMRYCLTISIGSRMFFPM